MNSMQRDEMPCKSYSICMQSLAETVARNSEGIRQLSEQLSSAVASLSDAADSGRRAAESMSGDVKRLALEVEAASRGLTGGLTHVHTGMCNVLNIEGTIECNWCTC